jgi:hypothetical protein
MKTAMSSMLATLTHQADPAGSTEQSAMPVVRDPIRPGQTYRLPSGCSAVVTGVGGANITLCYVPDELTMRRDFFTRLATRVLGTGAEPPG